MIVNPDVGTVLAKYPKNAKKQEPTQNQKNMKYRNAS